MGSFEIWKVDAEAAWGEIYWTYCSIKSHIQLTPAPHPILFSHHAENSHMIPALWSCQMIVVAWKWAEGEALSKWRKWPDQGQRWYHCRRQQTGSWKGGGLSQFWGGKDELTSIKSSTVKLRKPPYFSPASPCHWFGWLKGQRKTGHLKKHCHSPVQRATICVQGNDWMHWNGRVLVASIFISLPKNFLKNCLSSLGSSFCQRSFLFFLFLGEGVKNKFKQMKKKQVKLACFLFFGTLNKGAL